MPEAGRGRRGQREPSTMLRRPDCGVGGKFVKRLNSIPHGLCEPASGIGYNKDNGPWNFPGGPVAWVSSLLRELDPACHNQDSAGHNLRSGTVKQQRHKDNGP